MGQCCIAHSEIFSIVAYGTVLYCTLGIFSIVAYGTVLYCTLGIFSIVAYGTVLYRTLGNFFYSSLRDSVVLHTRKCFLF